LSLLCASTVLAASPDSETIKHDRAEDAKIRAITAAQSVAESDTNEKARPARPTDLLTPIDRMLRRMHPDIAFGVAGEDCATAAVIPSLPFSDTGDTTLFLDDYDEICPFDAPGAPDVVYSYAPAVDELVNISLCGDSAYDTKLFVYENVCGAFQSGTAIACNDDTCTTPSFTTGSFVSQLLDVSLTAGNTYYIVVDGWQGDSGVYTIDMAISEVGACCMADGSCAELTQSACEDGGGVFGGGGTLCIDATCTGSCCMTDGTCTDVSADDCATAGGTFGGIGSDCATTSCVGSCCLTDGTCTDLSEDACATAGGTFGGLGSDCATTICTGSCCMTDGSCADLSEDACAAAGGEFGGLGSDCLTTVCEFGACCVDGACIETSPADCDTAGGTYFGNDSLCADVDCTPPSNDTCDTAEAIAIGGSATGNTVLASTDSVPFCGTSAPGRGVWYSVVGNGGLLQVSTCNPGTDFDTKIQVFCDCEDLICVGGNDDAAGAPPECALDGLNRFSIVEWCSTAGQTYYIHVGGFLELAGNYELTVTDLDPGVLCVDPVSCEPPLGRCCVDGAPCPWDLDGNGIVGFSDLTRLLAVWGLCPGCPEDFDGNGSVGFSDLTALLANWGPCPSGPSCSDVTLAECDALGGTWDPTLDCTTPCPVPPDPVTNDTCDDCTVITDADLPFAQTIDTSGAMNEGGLAGSCNSAIAEGMDNDVWYCYTPSEDCFISLGIDYDYDGLVAIYTGPDCNTLTEIDCIDPQPVSTIIAATAGETYWFQVGDWGTADGGGITDITLDCFDSIPTGACCTGAGVCVELTSVDCAAAGGAYEGDGTDCVVNPCPVPPANDECTMAEAVGEGSFPYNTSLATDSDTSELDIICDETFGLFLGKDIWYRYTPSADGVATISLCLSAYDTRMAVYSDTCPPTNLELLACDDDGCGTIGGPSELALPVTGGVPVLIRVGGWAASSGAIASSGDGTMEITLGPIVP
jgi:hypothetical protein